MRHETTVFREENGTWYVTITDVSWFDKPHGAYMAFLRAIANGRPAFPQEMLRRMQAAEILIDQDFEIMLNTVQGAGKVPVPKRRIKRKASKQKKMIEPCDIGYQWWCGQRQASETDENSRGSIIRLDTINLAVLIQGDNEQSVRDRMGAALGFVTPFAGRRATGKRQLKIT